MDEVKIWSRDLWKSKRFQSTCNIFTFASLWHFLSSYEHEWYSRKFLLSFIQRSLPLPIFCRTFCGNFWKVCKNIQVFANDSRELFKIIFQFLFNFIIRCRVQLMYFTKTFTSIKTILIVKKIDLIQKYWVNFPNFKFLSPKNFTVCANGYCYVFGEINHFSKSFWVVNIKNSGFLKVETRFLQFETWLLLSIVWWVKRET